MKRNITKTRLTISISGDLLNVLDDKIHNRSKYIESLIYEDLMKNTNDDELKKILL